MLQAQIEAHLDTLVEEEVNTILANCKLSNKIKIIQSAPSEVRLSLL
jgi:hypothetical protein